MSKKVVDVTYECLYTEGGLEGGMAFSGIGTIDSDFSLEETLELVCGNEGLKHHLRYGLENPPYCIMLYIQTTPRSSEGTVKK